MMKTDEFKGDKSKFLAKKTYKDKLSIGSGKDQVDLYYFGVGHTNGDTFVVFPALRTMQSGDMFAWKALPYIDTSTAGASSPILRRSPRQSFDLSKRRHGHYRTYRRC